ncbi:Hypothetical_protein [Hexamita inflata]|uniref:Hypothetical_protein n=1 Tax=Hexamita inflata TaxID=28002 RepID=A0AA86TTQ9_9EUKA|nr:Hypothetical protein HINF_LOCUS16094 [Hexamita inflata]
MAMYSLWNRVRFIWNQSNPKPIHFGITIFRWFRQIRRRRISKQSPVWKEIYCASGICLYINILMSQTPNLKSSREVIPKRKHVLQLGIVFSSKWAQVLSHHTVLFFGFERDSKANLEFGLFQISTCVDSNPRDLEQFFIHTLNYSTNQNIMR